MGTIDLCIVIFLLCLAVFDLFVATAKKLLYGTVDIDMIAGPSEILIVADDTANPKYAAADLMSQAEHDKLASSVLITTSQRVADETVKEIERQVLPILLPMT